MIMEKIILASASPRRREILNSLKIPFEVIVSDVDESLYEHDSPDQLVRHLSLAKASAVALKTEEAIIIAADTVVVMDGRILGKPEDETDALRSLMALSGRSHEVYTGIAMLIAHQDRRYCDYCVTKVTMRPFSEDEARAYVRTGEPMDKAGAYGIQGIGAALIEHLEGDYFNVVGLPASKLIDGFNFLGYPYFKTFHPTSL